MILFLELHVALPILFPVITFLFQIPLSNLWEAVTNFATQPILASSPSNWSRISRSFPGTLADWSVRIMPPRGKRGGRKALEKLENVVSTEPQPKTTTKPGKRGRGRPAGKAKENRKMEEQASKKRKQDPPVGE